MPRIVFACSLMVALLSVSALSAAQAQPPAQFEAVEHYATLVSGGAKAPLRLMFSRGVTYAEHALFWSEERGTAVLPALYALIDAGARLEVEFHAAAPDGGMIVTRERMWVDGAAEALAPLRSTGVYVVDGDRILSITRVLDVDQRHALMREALVGTWDVDLEPTWFEHDAEGGFSYWHMEGSERAVIDSGRSTIEGDLWTVVRDEGTRVCDPGDVIVFRLRFAGPDTLLLSVIEDACRRWPGISDHRAFRVVD